MNRLVVYLHEHEQCFSLVTSRDIPGLLTLRTYPGYSDPNHATHLHTTLSCLPPSDPPSILSSPSPGALSSGAVAGIVIGVILAVVIIALIVLAIVIMMRYIEHTLFFELSPRETGTEYIYPRNSDFF